MHPIKMHKLLDWIDSMVAKLIPTIQFGLNMTPLPSIYPELFIISRTLQLRAFYGPLAHLSIVDLFLFAIIHPYLVHPLPG